jgi:hypothetical protein
MPSDESSTPVSTFPRPPPWQNSALPSHDPERSPKTPSRTSSQSQKKLPSIISNLHVASKRTSTSSSVYSVATTSPNPQYIGIFSIVLALGRANDDHSSTAPTSRSHSRSTSADSVLLSSLSHRHAIPPALLMPPTSPPTGPLPPPPLCHQYQFLRQSLLYYAQRHLSNAYASSACLRVARRPALPGA